ncbi:hypothetical protein [Haloarcula marismortui]|uniref:Uncharacterized protein n=1 Tax=Haloarcula marismortui ATCC 33799 TaxID=662475 RepID=M0KXB5_9EURY|nr:hypothetical protein [Haloarcula californiae]EMA24884.1 hypothetical protein C435_03288 [Haloarcula californiae ATCC 33799]
MGETPIVEGVVEFPSVEALKKVVDDLQHAGWLTDDETWIKSNGELNSVAGDYVAVNQEKKILRIPEGAYRNIHRGLPSWIADASAGGVVGTMQCNRIGLIGTAEDSMPGDNLELIDLESWGTDRGWREPPSMEDSQHGEQERDEWFQKVAYKFVKRHRNTVKGRLMSGSTPVEATAIP